MDNSYSVLEVKIEACLSEKVSLPKITEDWFINLSKDEKYAAASYLEQLVEMACFSDELKEYESDLLAYTAETKNESALKDWLDFAKVYRGKEFESAFKTLNLSPLLSWSKQQRILKPFDKIDFLENYAEFKQ